MRKLIGVVAAAIALFVSVSLAQDVRYETFRLVFRGDGDQGRNLVILENIAQLQSTVLLTDRFRCMAEVNVDSVPDLPKLELTIDLMDLTTGNRDRDTVVFNPKFLNLPAGTQANFRLLHFDDTRNYMLPNERRIPVTGRGELQIGEVVDTVSIEFGLRYLQGNEITKSRLPGDLLHITGSIPFRLSKFGIHIPKEALLRLDDRSTLRLDIYVSSAA